LKINRRFGETYCRLLQCQQISCAGGKQVLHAACFHRGFFLGLFFDLEDGGDVIFRNVG
jgi:hypothetical protein